jgi:hypothetical protein
VSEFQPARIFLLSPSLLDIHFLANFSKKLDKGFGDKIMIPVYHFDAPPAGWVQEALKSLPDVDVEGKQWEKYIVEGIYKLNLLWDKY